MYLVDLAMRSPDKHWIVCEDDCRLRLTCELVDRASREWADPSSLQDTREKWRLTLTQGWRAWSCNISSLGPQTFGFEPELHHAHSSIFICAVQMSSCHVSLCSCWVPSSFFMDLFIAPSTLVLLGEGLVNRRWASPISLLEICSPSSGESCWYKPRCSWSWVPSCARLFSRQWAGGARSCSREWARLERKCRLLCGSHWRPKLFSSWSSFPVNFGFQQW